MHIVMVGWSRTSVVLVMLGIGLESSVVADTKRRVTTTSSGECLTREAVIAALEGVLPHIMIIALDQERIPLVVVSDDETGDRVELAGVTRTFTDVSVPCEDRVRRVAVVIGLALAPPVIDVGAPNVTPAIESAHPAPSATFTTQIETGSVIEASPRHDGDLISTGIDLRLAIGRADGGLVLGCELITPVLLKVIGGRARVTRVPLDLALRSRVSGARFAGGVELGARFTIQRSEGVDVMYVGREVRIEVGARLAARFEVWPAWRPYGAYVVIAGEYAPRPSIFTLNGRDVGEMPSFWIGASLGLAIRMR